MPTDTLGGEIWEHRFGRALVSTDARRLDLTLIHGFLSRQSYWARDIPLETVRRSLAGSLCFGLYLDDRQAGFARLITDCATTAYLADVFVLPQHRGRGLSRRLLETIHSHPRLQGLRRWVLVTADAHGLYEKFGFQPLQRPETYMEINRPDLYRQSQQGGET